ncbi:MAG: hypothetical protein KC643_17100, partial [Nitrospira sp.]|nr:hypothetical protein [Nitrospira sp.]
MTSLLGWDRKGFSLNLSLMVAWAIGAVMGVGFPGWAADSSDFPTHHFDHDADAQVDTLPMVHVHGFRLNKDQQQGPVPQKTPWPTVPPSLVGEELDDWLKARILVSKDGESTVVILHPATHR